MKTVIDYDKCIVSMSLKDADWLKTFLMNNPKDTSDELDDDFIIRKKFFDHLPQLSSKPMEIKCENKH